MQHNKNISQYFQLIFGKYCEGFIQNRSETLNYKSLEGLILKYCWPYLLIFFYVTSAASAWGAGSIAGTLSYNGNQTGTPIIAVFTSPVSCSATNPSPFSFIQNTGLGSYQITGLPDGNYYIASVITTCGSNCSPNTTDPWGIYNGCADIRPVTVQGGTTSNINISLVDGTKAVPNPFADNANYYYLSVTGNASGWINFSKSIDQLSDIGVSVTGDGGAGRSGHGWTGVEVIMSWASRSPLKFLPPSVGQTWTGVGSSNSYEIDSVSVVQSVNDAVTALAGTFTNCAHVNETWTWPNGYDRSEYPVALDKWFCPGIGPTKLIITDNLGNKNFGELTSFNISNVNTDYFPLEVGYQWTFTMDDGRSATWIVDDKAPDVYIDVKPSNPSQQNSATFNFSSTDLNATFECKLDNSAFTACGSPYIYNNLSEGAHIFSVRAKSAAGHVTVSPAIYSWEISLTSSLTLSLAVSGTGNGSVNSDPSGLIVCTYPPQAGVCSTIQPPGYEITLLATPASDSMFGGWGNACSNCTDISCLVNLESNKNCTATFTTLPPVRIGGANPVYLVPPTLQNTYDNALNGAVIEMKNMALDITDTLTANSASGKSVSLKGGFDASYNSNSSGFTTISGPLVIGLGTVLMERVIIQ
jgi:hypothetical protein